MAAKLKFGTNNYKFTDIPGSHDAMVEFVRTADALGYYHIRVVDHVLGVHADRHGGIDSTPYTADSNLHECLTLLAYLAAVTTNIRLETGVLGLPQRQTALVAKQAAEIDILSRGRLILGVGVGYNNVEFEALGAGFSDRGKRFEEQVHVLRQLWTQDEVTFSGEWHSLRDVSLAPRPVQRPIPLWFGLGRVIAPIPPDIVLHRVGRLADGWLPLFKVTDPEAPVAVGKVREAACRAGRDPAAIGMEMNLRLEDKSDDALLREIDLMVELGAERVNVGFAETTPDALIAALHRFRKLVDRYEAL
ncbi:MAG: putative oxidoreductase [Sphingomonas bacterium]|uniref:LLM class F420-dependent oxidoreductase n=1 Tax=Sphingomonas bacterium TaxID=1895847 RepID=UPI002639C44E|nr:LLM class F420-dependent oxidoreductase [Sphingomonas bacterium]MDB5703871.1 putative oxidoreductase [Sphingomonas bacterium]